MNTKKKSTLEAPTILNRRARFDYHLEEMTEVGIVLQGSEVKSLRKGNANIQDAYAVQKDEEIWLLNCYIGEYEGSNRFNHEPRRPRKLLLHKKEIRKFIGKLRNKGITLVPVKLYFNNKGTIKLQIALGKGKKEFDKREDKKTRDWEREKAAALKNRE